MWIKGIEGPLQVPVLGDPKPTPEGPETRELVGWAPGYHLNVPSSVALEVGFSLVPFIVAPRTLVVVFAGDSPDSPSLTVPVVFESEDQAREVLGGLWIEPEAV